MSILRLQGRAVALVLGFGALSLSLLWAAGEKVDAWTFLLFNLRGRRPLWLDWAMLALLSTTKFNCFHQR